jgi:hypothetical protein
MKKSPEKSSIASSVFSYLDADPYIRQSIRLGIANLSAIAGKIRTEKMPKSSLGAIKAAVRRYGGSQKFYDYSANLRELLKKTRMSLTSNAAVMLLKPHTFTYADRIFKALGGKEFAMISSNDFITLILPDEHVSAVAKAIGRGNILETIRDQCIITLATSSELEVKPGWVAFFAEALARGGINIREFYSCYTDTVFVVAKKDATKAYELLSKLL